MSIISNKKINTLFIKKNILFLACCMLVLLSCQKEPDTTAIKLTPFFDLETYFKKEVEGLKNVKQVEKTAAINGQQEKKTLENIDFSQELAIFTQSNINKTGWLDKYVVDSIYNTKEELVQLKYTAKEERMRTRQVAIFFENKEVSKVEVQNGTSNIIAQTQQNLVYLPKKGYTIKSEQDIVFSEPREMLVEVRF